MESDSDSTVIYDSDAGEPMDVEPHNVYPLAIHHSTTFNFGSTISDRQSESAENVDANVRQVHNDVNDDESVGNADHGQGLLLEFDENASVPDSEQGLLLEASSDEDSRSRSPVLTRNIIRERYVVLRVLDDVLQRNSELTQQSNSNEEPLNLNQETSNSVGDETNDREQSSSKQLDQDIDDDDGKTCPICLDNWTNLGDHRICALKCGHLFGLKCITHWFSLQKKKSCPTCKKKASRSDIRHIYAKKLVATDVSELELLKGKLCEVTEEKNKISLELTKALCREHLIEQELQTLKKNTLNFNSAFNAQHKKPSQSSSNVRLYMDKSLEICKENGCRVLSVLNNSDIMVASMKSTNTLFPGFGARKIDISAYKPTAYIPLHTKSIRDLRFHPQNPWLLSVSLDKSFKVTDVNSNAPVVVYSGEVPLWSCCWDKNDNNVFFVGKQQGSVAKFDIRQVNQAIDTYEVIGDLSPVVAVSSVAANPSGPLINGGIVTCKLNSLWVIENMEGECKRHQLPMEGPFISMVYNDQYNQLLLSTRANSRVMHTRHHLCSIEVNESSNLVCNTIHCLKGSNSQRFLSRSCLLSHGSDNFVAAYQESDRSVCLWSVDSGQNVCNLPARNPVLDLYGVNKGENSFMVSLTESKLEFFKFTNYVF